jgi:DNA integrity scanning protein DisA with diadenylate cyclase activity
MGAHDERESQRKLLFELATLDGAVLFDGSAVLIFGGVLHLHDAAQRHLGARTTAAYSAFHWGGVPVMISTDGEITMVFESTDPRTGRSSVATLEFM